MAGSTVHGKYGTVDGGAGPGHRGPMGQSQNKLARSCRHGANTKSAMGVPASCDPDLSGHRRVRRIVVGYDGNSTPYDSYYNSRWQRLEVRRFGDTVAYEQYLWDVWYVDAPICRWHDADNDGTFEPDANEMHYYTNGANFNVTALLDANSGDVVERYLYDPYGRRTVLNGQTDADPNVTEWHPDGDNRSDTDNPLGHQGLPHNDETGFLDNRMRPRCPGLGRWLVPDYWAVYRDGMNLCQYAGSNVPSSRDPSGLLTDFLVTDAGEPWTLESPASYAKRRLAARLDRIQRDHRGFVYYRPLGMEEFFHTLKSALSEQVKDIGDYEPVGGKAAYKSTIDVLFIPIDTANQFHVIHELVHVVDDLNDWYLTAWSAEEQAEALAYGVQHLLEYAYVKLGAEWEWGEAVPGTPAADARCCEDYQRQWRRMWEGTKGLFGVTVTWYGMLSRPLTEKDLWDVNAKLKFRLSCNALKPAYEADLKKRLKQKCNLSCDVQMSRVFR